MSYVVKRIRLVVPANKAKPSPSIGQALGSVGINMMKFCKEFNTKSVRYIDELPLRVRLSIMNDGSYDFTIHAPQTSFFLKRAANIQLGAHKPKHETVGTVHVKQLYHIAQIKQNDSGELELTPLMGIFRSIIGQCASMGLKVDFSTEQQIIERKAAEEAARKAAAEEEDKFVKRKQKKIKSKR